MHFQTNRPWQRLLGTLSERNYLTWAISARGRMKSRQTCGGWSQGKKSQNVMRTFTWCVLFFKSAIGHITIFHVAWLYDNTIWVNWLALNHRESWTSADYHMDVCNVNVRALLKRDHIMQYQLFCAFNSVIKFLLHQKHICSCILLYTSSSQ